VGDGWRCRGRDHDQVVPAEPPAANLFVRPNTLKTHLRAIYSKLGAESREEAVIRAREGGLI
jgi:ATP/maltotriose-dependent transcriptional regulator MalT